MIGTVEEPVVGEVQPGFPGDEYPTRIVHTTVTVEEALSDRLTARGSSCRPRGSGFVGNPEDWRVAGHRVLPFLEPSPERKSRCTSCPGQLLADHVLPRWRRDRAQER